MRGLSPILLTGISTIGLNLRRVGSGNRGIPAEPLRQSLTCWQKISTHALLRPWQQSLPKPPLKYWQFLQGLVDSTSQSIYRLLAHKLQIMRAVFQLPPVGGPPRRSAAILGSRREGAMRCLPSVVWAQFKKRGWKFES